MEEFTFVDFLLVAAVSHFIVSAYNYIDIRRSDKGIEPKKRSRFGEWLMYAISIFPLLFYAAFQYTFGLFSYLTTKRICEKLAKAEDEIVRLRKENERLMDQNKKSNDAWVHVTDVINKSENIRFRINTYDDLLSWYYLYVKRDL